MVDLEILGVSLMTQIRKLQAKWAGKRLARVMIRAEVAMNPYMPLLQSGEGLLVNLMIAGVAQAVAAGSESHEYLAKIVVLAAEITGIPRHALEVHAEALLFMATKGKTGRGTR